MLWNPYQLVVFSKSGDRLLERNMVGVNWPGVSERHKLDQLVQGACSANDPCRGWDDRHSLYRRSTWDPPSISIPRSSLALRKSAICGRGVVPFERAPAAGTAEQGGDGRTGIVDPRVWMPGPTPRQCS
jgi:hypothetical protein